MTQALLMILAAILLAIAFAHEANRLPEQKVSRPPVVPCAGANQSVVKPK